MIELVVWTAQAVCSYREAAEAPERPAGLTVSKSTIHRMVRTYGMKPAEERNAEGEALWESGVKKADPPPPREGQKEALGIGLDRVMVWVDDGWHEVKVGSCFTFGPDAEGEVKAQEVGYWAWYGEVETFRQTIWGYAYHRGLGVEGKAVVIGDGAGWIDGFVETYCPGGIRIVDWYHAMERLWALGREAYGDEAEKWVEKMKAALWRGDVETVVAECEAVLAEGTQWSEEALRTPAYFRERAEHR